MEKSTDKSAIALKYDGINTPYVAAKGYNELAEHIIAQVKESGGLIHKDEQLLGWLNHLQQGDAIPEELYLIIAELIAYAWFLDGKAPPGWEGPRTIKEEV